jgi:type VI protein secretion system component VasK
MLVLQIAVGIVLGVLILANLQRLIAGSIVLFFIILALAAYAAVVYILWLMTGNGALSFVLAFWIIIGLLIGGEKLITWYRKRRPPPSKDDELGLDERYDSTDFGEDDLDPLAVARAEEKLIRLYRKRHAEVPN